MIKNKFSNWLVTGKGILLYLSLFLFACGEMEIPPILVTESPPSTVVAPQQGYKAPDFELQTTDGNPISLSNYGGKFVVVNFWATWCPPCRSEMPDMQRIYEDYRREGLIILGINNKESSDVVKEFGEEYGLTFPMLLDSEGGVSDLYQVRSFPTTLFIDSNGIVSSIQIGSMDYASFQTEIQRVFNLTTTIEPSVTYESTAEIQDTTITACVTANALNVRTGPSTEYDIFTTIPNGECYRFDARDSSSSWIRLYDLMGENEKRLWVSTIYIDTQDRIEILPVR